jgi:predicted PurR-regulated permease PerM
VPPERVISIRPRTVLLVAGLLIALALALWVVYVSRRVLTWVLIAALLALALNPAVERLRHHRPVTRRGAAAGIIYVLALLVLVGLGFLLVPPVVDQVSGLADAAPGYVQDITAGRGPLGFLETRYHVVDRVRDALAGNGSSAATFAGGTVISITKGVLTTIVAIVTIAFLTFFMLLEGPAWMERLYALLPADQEPRWRAVSARIAATVSGYMAGNLLISLIAGTSTALVLLLAGVPYALALGLLVAILDLIPLAGATVAAVVVTVVALIASGATAAIVVGVFFVVYQQLENHLLQPLVYGRTVELSPLAVLISVLVGAEVAGILGALCAIPVAGTIQILFLDWLSQRRAGQAAAAAVAVDDGRARPLERPADVAGA